MALGKLKWWQKTIVYEAYVKSFLDTKGTGTGTIAGITRKLDYLKSLGVGAVWLTPVFASPMRDNGYDVADYRAINPDFGTLADMDELFAQAQAHDMRIVLDLVLNHTSDECAWFRASSASRSGDKADWYIWRDPKPDGSAPTNWRSVFGGPAWTYCPARGQYYLHTFAREQPDLNWENPVVRQAMYDVANFWLDRGAGGFRIDSISYLKKPAFRDCPPDGADGLAGIDDATANTPGVLDFVKEFNAQVLAGRDVFAVGEANRVHANELSGWLGKAKALDMVFEFTHLQLISGKQEVWCLAPEWELADLKRALADTERRTARNGWPPIFFECHDQPRSVSNFFEPDVDRSAAAKALACVLLTLRGTPFIYQGEELGLANAQWPCLESFDDALTMGQYQRALDEGFSPDEALDVVRRFGRDNARTPMQWDAGPNAGFTAGTPWLPVHGDFAQQNVQVESADPTSVLNWYRLLARLRAEHSELIDGDFHMQMRTDQRVFAFSRENSHARAVVLANFSSEPAMYRESLVKGAVLLADSAGGAVPGHLAPLQAVVYECVR
ncbi:MAG: glycoside hydrolase family 13 protein [Eggerthellaceae bacterium]|jgi:alpha-glucosidase